MSDNIKELRQKIRHNQFTQSTSLKNCNAIQGNVVILPATYQEEFLQFCRLNYKSCPVIAFSQKGQYRLDDLGDVDIRTDVPEYFIFENGQFKNAQYDIKSLWTDDLVSIILGCSFSFENALQQNNIAIPHIQQGKNVPMYNTNIALNRTQHFFGNMVVSMRCFDKHNIKKVIEITTRFDQAHGTPIYVGEPSPIGIDDIYQCDYGDNIDIDAHKIPLFWACGVSTQVVLNNAKLPFYITHSPGKMLITDIQCNL